MASVNEQPADMSHLQGLGFGEIAPVRVKTQPGTIEIAKGKANLPGGTTIQASSPPNGAAIASSKTITDTMPARRMSASAPRPASPDTSSPPPVIMQAALAPPKKEDLTSEIPRVSVNRPPTPQTPAADMAAQTKQAAQPKLSLSAPPATENEVEVAVVPRTRTTTPTASPNAARLQELTKPKEMQTEISQLRAAKDACLNEVTKKRSDAEKCRVDTIKTNDPSLAEKARMLDKEAKALEDKANGIAQDIAKVKSKLLDTISQPLGDAIQKYKKNELSKADLIEKLLAATTSIEFASLDKTVQAGCLAKLQKELGAKESTEFQIIQKPLLELRGMPAGTTPEAEKLNKAIEAHLAKLSPDEQVDFVSYALECEVAIEANLFGTAKADSVGAGSVLRATEVGAKIYSTFINQQMKSHLQKNVTEPLAAKLKQAPEGCNLTNLKDKAGKADYDPKKDQDFAKKVGSEALDDVNKTIQQNSNPQITTVHKRLQASMEKYFAARPTKEADAAKFVATTFFIRAVNPAITDEISSLNNKAAAITKESGKLTDPDAIKAAKKEALALQASAKNLVIVSKLLQNYVNDIREPKKEQYMKFSASFIDENATQLAASSMALTTDVRKRT